MAESLATWAAVTLVAIDCHHVLIEPPFRGRGGNAASKKSPGYRGRSCGRAFSDSTGLS